MRKRRMLPLLGPMCPSEAFGHAAFMLAGTAFLEPDILSLRAISIAAGGATLVFTYFHPTGRPLWLPFGWNVVFMLINATQIYHILHDSSEAKKLPPQALELWREVFAAHGLSDVEFSKLLSAGTWTTFRKGTTLQEEGQPSNSVFLIVHGGADVLVHGDKAHHLHEHQFIGDMGISSGIVIKQPVHGVAHVETNQQTTCLVWRRQQLYDCMDASPEVASALRAAITSDVVRKHCDPERDGEQAQLRELWLARYGSILRAVLDEGEVSRDASRDESAMKIVIGIAHALR